MNVDFNSMPEAIEYLTVQVETIKELLQQKAVLSTNQEKILDFNAACAYMKKKKIPMSKSRLYKLVSATGNGIPFRKAGNRLLFYTNELDVWCEEQIGAPATRQESVMAVVKVARKRNNN